jgi:hypothetical protein
MNQIVDAFVWLAGWVVVLGLFGWWFYLNRNHSDSSSTASTEEVFEDESGRKWPLDERADALVKKMSVGDRSHYG